MSPEKNMFGELDNGCNKFDCARLFCRHDCCPFSLQVGNIGCNVKSTQTNSEQLNSFFLYSFCYFLYAFVFI